MFKKLKYLVSLIFILIVITNCKKDQTEVPATPSATSNPFNLKLSFQVDGQPLVFDTIRYVNDAGNHYAVSTILFYLSQIYLIKSDSQKVLVKDWLYIDARTASTLNNSFSSVPEGSYIGLTFNIGLDSIQNITNGLPSTLENLAMQWPVPMGGGYHFLRLEGYFTDTSGTPGFAMHLGTNSCLCKVSLHGNIRAGKNFSTNIIANINEWFRNPHTYDFNIDGNYIMGNITAMTKIAENGTNVFTIQ